MAELEFKRARETLFTLELHKDKRGQTFFNIEFGTYLALGQCHISVSRQMTCGVSKIAEAAEESARKGRPVPIAWKPDEVPNGYIMNA